MTFSSTITGWESIGSLRMTYGTYSNQSGDTGGDIAVGLRVVDTMYVQPKGPATEVAPVINETFPLVATDVTVVLGSGTSAGYWVAFGKV